MHRDLKLENVLFKDRDELFVTVIDFGISGVCIADHADKVDAGSIMYMAPECFVKEPKTNPALDVWAIGMMFYAMLYGSHPFYSKDEEELVNNIKHAEIIFHEEEIVSEDAKNVIKRMLDRDPSKRIELLKFMETDYYKMSTEDYQRKFDAFKEVEVAKRELAAAEEEKQQEKDSLANNFSNQLHVGSGGKNTTPVSGKNSNSKRPKKATSPRGKGGDGKATVKPKKISK